MNNNNKLWGDCWAMSGSACPISGLGLSSYRAQGTLFQYPTLWTISQALKMIKIKDYEIFSFTKSYSNQSSNAVEIKDTLISRMKSRTRNKTQLIHFTHWRRS